MIDFNGIDDRELSIPLYSRQCTLCTNLLEDGKGRRCRVYIELIPLEIWEAKVSCSQFEKRSKVNSKE